MLRLLLMLAVTVLLQLCTTVAHTDLRNNSLEFSISSDDRMTTFLHADRYVYHMEPDLHVRGNILYVDGNAIKTTDGVTSTTIAGHSTTSYYHEGVGKLARFGTISGFRQISPTEIVVVDTGYHCLRLINRITLQTSRFAGICNNAGYAQGTTSARFHSPWSIISDNKRTGMLIVADRSNNALRHVNSLLGNPRTVSTIIQSNTIATPYGLAQDPATGDIYITTHLNVFKMTYSSKSLYNITGAQHGFRDCHFSVASFHHTREIILIENGSKLVIADQEYHRARVLNLNTSITTSLCAGVADHMDGDMSTCTLYNPYSLMVLNNTLYVGEYQRIRKVQGDYAIKISRRRLAMLHTFREVASSDTGVAIVDVPLLEGSGKLSLEPGSYPFHIFGSSKCTVLIKDSDHRLRRRLVFTSVYDADCETATGNITNSSLTHQLARRAFMRQLTDICIDDCNRADDSDIEMNCTNHLLTVSWPTDVTYSGDVVQIPVDLGSRLASRINAKGAAFYLVLLQNTPPLIFPNKSTENGYMRARISSFCVGGMSYNKALDSCQ